MDNYQERFPIGEFSMPETVSKEQINLWIDAIEQFPRNVKNFLLDLNAEDLEWKYREGGWNIKQVIHHCADSHMNSYIRFKLALTEDSPTIRPYFEDRWAELPDGQNSNLAPTLTLLTGLHARWTEMLRAISEEELKREFIHPEHGTKVSLAENIGTYAWHCEHHFAHLRLATEKKIK